jgi:hypothetical protein
MRHRVSLILIFLKFSQCKFGESGEMKGKEKDDLVDTSNESQPEPSGDPSIPLDDLIILFILTFFFIAFLYFFIRYLLRKPRQPQTLTTTSTSKSADNKATRRYRFGRIRKSSQGKPWLYPMDPLPKLPVPSVSDDHDADNLIQLDISTESTLNLHDPFNLFMSSSSRKSNNSWFEMSDIFGVVLAAISSLLFILILSNFEE